MSAVIASTVISGASLVQGHMAQRDARKQRRQAAAEQAEEQAKLDAEIAQEKRKRNEQILSRLSRGGSSSTIFAGATGQVGKKSQSVQLLGQSS